MLELMTQSSLLFRAEYTTLRRDFDIVEPELRRARGAEQTVRMQNAQMNNQIAELKDSLARKDLEIAKLTHKIDVSGVT